MTTCFAKRLRLAQWALLAVIAPAGVAPLAAQDPARAAEPAPLPTRATPSLLPDVRWTAADPARPALLLPAPRNTLAAEPTAAQSRKFGKLPIFAGISAAVAAAALLMVRSASSAGAARPTGVPPVATTVSIGSISIGGPR